MSWTQIEFGVLGEIKNLRQVGELKAYRNKFEELRWLLVSENPMYDEAFFITNFLTGLKEELRYMVLSTKTFERSLWSVFISGNAFGSTKEDKKSCQSHK